MLSAFLTASLLLNTYQGCNATGPVPFQAGVPSCNVQTLEQARKPKVQTVSDLDRAYKPKHLAIKLFIVGAITATVSYELFHHSYRPFGRIRH